MRENLDCRQNRVNLCLLGVSLDTSNMGVGALAESAVKCAVTRWPEAKVTFLGCGRIPQKYAFTLNGRKVSIETMPIRFSKNILSPYHFFLLMSVAFLCRLLPFKKIKRLFSACNPCAKTILEADIVADLTGGDSFSDIYGLRRFLFVSLRKFLILQFGKKLVLLPQTYGPFRGRIAKMAARYLLRRSSKIYARDLVGLRYARYILGRKYSDKDVRFVPDVAFILDAREPGDIDIKSILPARTRGTVVVGVNLSGLLFRGGYTQNNMFGLKANYRELMHKVIETILREKNVVILLVPHVFCPVEFVESDINACRQVYNEFKDKYKNRIFYVDRTYDQGEIKYIIGKCDMLIGSRMHACIAALSQNVPAVGLAYSDKFRGVFDSIGIGDLVVDLRRCDIEETLDGISKAYQNRQEIAKYLKDTIPSIQKEVLSIFKDIL